MIEPILGIFLSLYFVCVVSIFIHLVKEGSCHSSPLAMILIALTFPISYTIKFLFNSVEV